MYVTIGSVTLLKWKLLATPQLGGASSYFSNIARPGVHVKSWRGNPKNEKAVSHDNSSLSNTSIRSTGEEELGTSVDITPSSSTTVAGHSPSSGKHSGDQRRGVHSRVKVTNSNTTSNSSVDNITGMNDISGLLLNTSSNNNTNDTLPHPAMMGGNVTGTFNPVLNMGWLPGMKQPMATSYIGLASLLDDKVD